MTRRQRLFLPLSLLYVLCGFLSAPIYAQDAPKAAGTEVPAPKRTKTVLPEYPPEAQSQGIRGIVILELVINPQGRIDSVLVVRSIAGLDEAAIAAVQKWEYEVTKVDGKPVSVRLTVPITFALKVPDVFREEGIPALRQGAAPAFPPQAAHGKGASASAEVTLDADGAVADALVTSGESPWTDALLQALRTWKFAVENADTILAFRVEAQFIPGAKGEVGKVDLRLNNLRKSQAKASPAEAPALPPPTAPADMAPPPAAPSAPSPPTPLPASPAVPAPVASAEGQGPAPSSQAPPATPVPPLAPPAADTPKATPAPKASQPPIETLLVPTPKPPAPPTPIENGVSAIQEISLSPGVPDLIRGRRPVPPPLARMAGATGSVQVRFSVNAAGGTTVLGAEGPDLLRPAAEEAVSSWSFRRASAERLHLVAAFDYRTEGASATVHVDPQAQP